MNAADSLVLEFLATRAGFVPNQVEHLQCWWRAVRGEEESLAEFLFRQRLLSEATKELFARIADRHLSRQVGFALIDLGEMARFRRRLPEAASLINAALPETTTLLTGQDTAIDLDLPTSDCSAVSESPRVGAKVGRYLLTDWLGQGASGMVYRALHPTLNIPVAIKVLHAPSQNGTSRRQRFAAEARLLALLNHPNIVRLYDFETEAAQPYLVLEHVNGPSLAELIEQCGRLQAYRGVRILKQLAGALAAAHERGIVHRDIKPGNILISRSGEVKLSDLGLATVMNRNGPACESPVSASARVGTINYVAPEMVGTSQLPDARSDIYSLGATMYHALTGRPPFEGDSIWEIIERQTKFSPAWPCSIAPDLPSDLAELLMRMMARNPALRPATIQDLQCESALNSARWDEFGSGFKPSSSSWRRMLEKVGNAGPAREPVQPGNPAFEFDYPIQEPSAIAPR